MPWNVKVLNADKVYNKLDPDRLIKPHEKAVFAALAPLGKSTMVGATPARTGATRASIMAESTESMARVTAPRFPIVFLERGSAYPAPKGTRTHRRRRELPRSALRIQPRRMIRKTLAALRAEMRRKVVDLKTAIEREWSK